MKRIRRGTISNTTALSIVLLTENSHRTSRGRPHSGACTWYSGLQTPDTGHNIHLRFYYTRKKAVVSRSEEKRGSMAKGMWSMKRDWVKRRRYNNEGLFFRPFFGVVWRCSVCRVHWGLDASSGLWGGSVFLLAGRERWILAGWMGVLEDKRRGILRFICKCS